MDEKVIVNIKHDFTPFLDYLFKTIPCALWAKVYVY